MRCELQTSADYLQWYTSPTMPSTCWSVLILNVLCFTVTCDFVMFASLKTSKFWVGHLSIQDHPSQSRRRLHLLGPGHHHCHCTSTKSPNQPIKMTHLGPWTRTKPWTSAALHGKKNCNACGSLSHHSRFWSSSLGPCLNTSRFNSC